MNPDQPLPPDPLLRFMRNGRMQRAAEVAFAFVLTAIFTGWLLRPMPAFIGSRTPGFSGDAVLNAYILAWGQHALTHDPLAVFNANFLYPTPGTLAISENMLAVAALTLPLAPAGNPILVFNAAILLSFVLCGGRWYWALTRWGLGRTASMAGAFAFAFTPWRIAHMAHAQLLMSWWTPVVLAGAEAWLRSGSRKGALCAAAALGASFYSCVYNAYFTGLFVVVFLLAGLAVIRPPRAQWRRMILGALPALLLLALLLAPAFPAYHSMKTLLGEVNTGDLLERRGASFSDYLRGPGYQYVGRSWIIRSSNPHSDVPWENLIYVGVVPWLLAGLLPPALWLLRRRGHPVPRAHLALAWMLAAAGLFTFVLTLGPKLHWNGRLTGIDLPYGFLHRNLPGFSATRVPPRAAQFVALALTGLAALSIHAWSDWITRRSGAWPGRLTALLGFGLLFCELPGSPIGVAGNGDYARHLRVHEELAGMTSGPSLTLPLDDGLNYLVPLTTAPHFRPTPNGVSGHLPGGNGAIFDRFRQRPWDAAQADLLRWLGIRYLIIDEPLYARESAQGAGEVRETLARLGLAFEERRFEPEKITVFTLTGADPRLPAGRDEKPLTDWSHTLTWKSWKKVEFFVWMRNVGPSAYLPKDAKAVRVEVTGFDERGGKAWSRAYDKPLPPFMLSDQVLGFDGSPRRRDVAKTGRIRMRLTCPALGIEHEREIRLERPEKVD